jgi:hypothetical protein
MKKTIEVFVGLADTRWDNLIFPDFHRKEDKKTSGFKRTQIGGYGQDASNSWQGQQIVKVGYAEDTFCKRIDTRMFF